MKPRIWTGTCAAIVGLATAGMLAQTPAQPPTSQQSTPQTATPQPSPTQPQTATSSTDQKVTVTGCLKAAPQAASDTANAGTAASPTGTTGAAGSTAGTAGTTGTAGAAGTSGTTTSPATGNDQKFVLTAASMTPADTANSAQTYRLIANPSALTAHVGKKLELTGTIDKSSTADPNDPSAAAPALRVESGKIVAASCEP
jgi:hypothetical protein